MEKARVEMTRRAVICLRREDMPDILHRENLVEYTGQYLKRGLV